MSLILCCILPVEVYGNDITTEDQSENEHIKRTISIDSSKDSSLLVNASYLLAQIKSTSKENWKKWVEQGAMPVALVISIGLFWKMRQRVAMERNRNHVLEQQKSSLEVESSKAKQKEATSGRIIAQLFSELKVKNDIKECYFQKKVTAEAEVENLKSTQDDLQRKLTSAKEENEQLKKEKETMMPKPLTEQAARDLIYSAALGIQNQQPPVTTTPQAQQDQQPAAGGIVTTVTGALGTALHAINPWGAKEE
jgi:hypothetical protein